MKTIFKSTVLFLSAAVLAVSCEKALDFQKKVEAAPGLVYLQSGEGNYASALISLGAEEAEGGFSAEFPVLCNTSLHPAQVVKVSYSPEEVTAYNAKKGTAFEALPEKYVRLSVIAPADADADEGDGEEEDGEESAPAVLPANSVVEVSLAENARSTVEKVQLALTDDLNTIPGGKYLVPLVLSAPELGSSEIYGVFYLEVTVEQNLLTRPASFNSIPGLSSWGKNEWTSSTSPDGIFTVDMQSSHMVTALALTGTANINAIEYSSDGTTWKQAGTPTQVNYVSSGGRYYIPFLDYLNGDKNYIQARYFRFHQNASVTDFDILEKESESDTPELYFAVGNDNVIESALSTGSFGVFYFDAPAFGLNLSVVSDEAVSGELSVDNSLVDVYNEARGTAFVALPEENLNLTGTNLSVAPGSKTSSSQLTFGLKGDLSALDNGSSFLIPITLTTSAAVNEKRGTVYIELKPEVLESILKKVTRTADMVGSQIATATRRNFSADVTNYSRLFDNSTSSYVNFTEHTGNVVTIDMKANYKFSGINVRGYSYVYPSIEKLEVSTDGVNFDNLGNVGPDYFFMSGTQCYSSLLFGMTARYIRLTFGMESQYWDSGYHVITEIYIYAQ